MKKILHFLAGTIMIFLSGYPLHAQTTTDVQLLNIKAVRDFIRSYKNASDAKWYELSDGFVVHFYMNNIKHRAFYKRNGSWLHTLAAYTDDGQLPSWTRHRVKSVYYDYTIFLVTEIQLAKKTIYLVKIEDRTCWKTIRVCEGEDMEEIESCFKL